ncbi:MAG: CusA/CzcA family heavy metal efflux RND transporter [Crocinitomicaceae bacterium]|nr:CusA/CzcA family heavy metal efflux RND transporter [Crocinitomicaceae bacterium]
MIQKIIAASVHNKFIVLLFVTGLILWGSYSVLQISVDAVPDVTNNQVQIITTSRNLSTQDVEQFITYPVELEMANIPGVKEIRSISKFGLSVVTVVFEDEVGTFLPRQLITEKLKTAEANIPTGFGTPFMGPITTGLGEIYQYTLEVKPEFKDQYTPMDLRTIQDWIVKRALSGIPGVVEINTWGGLLKQYEVELDPDRMNAMHISINEVFTAIEENNSVGGGGYIEKEYQTYFIRGEGLITSLDDIRNIVVANRDGIPVYVKDVADVEFGSALRFGAITGNGEGEKVMGQVMLLKDASTNTVLESVKKRVDEIQSQLPEGVYINPFLERSELIGKTTFTIAENLILGAAIVILVVILLLGNIRAGLIISSVIPLCLLFAIALMNSFGISANLMSLGAVDFGIIIDGAIIIAEFVLFTMTAKKSILTHSSSENYSDNKDEIVIESANKMMRSAIFGQLIILIVFIPILVLTGVEGKMFRPMALTFSFALIGAMILCLTYVPVMAALFLKPAADKKSFSDRIMDFLMKIYEPIIRLALRWRTTVIALSLGWLGFSFFLFSTMGGEFIPTLDEGDIVIQPVIPTGTSLTETIEITTKIESILKTNFVEVDQVVSRIGAAEIPTDPMSMEEVDVIIKLKPKSEWVNADTKDDLIEMMEDKLAGLTGIEYEFTQPIEMRFNELITGVRADLAIKIYGQDLDVLAAKANEVQQLIKHVEGAEDITVEKTEGLPQMLVRYDRAKIAHYNLQIADLNELIEIAFGGKKTGEVFEGERKFDLVVRLKESERKDISDIENMLIELPDGNRIPMREVADISYDKGPAKISRDNTRRRVVIGVNVRNRDLQSVVEEIQGILNEKLDLPDGYYVDYGGQFENLNHARQRLMMAVPLALVLIFILLYFTFNSVKEALLVYAAIPLSATGGIILLYLRDLPFSISAGVGFIALFGIAVLNGIVLIEHFKEMRHNHQGSLKSMIIHGTKQRIRPVLLTASAAALGFLPMALSGSAGSEVQRPLATVVIGGLISSTLLTLIILPVLYHLSISKKELMKKRARHGMVLTLLLLMGLVPQTFSQMNITVEQAVDSALTNNSNLLIAELQTEQVRYLNKTALLSEKLNVTFGYGQINGTMNDYQLNLVQQFYFPTVYVKQKQVNMQQQQVAQAWLDLTKSELEYEVRATCQHLIYLYQVLNALSNLKNQYTDFADKAQIRYQAGDATLLEWNLALAKKEEIELLLRSEKSNREIYYANLKYLTKTQSDIALIDTNLMLIDLINPDTLNVQNALLVTYYEAMNKLAEKKIELSKTGYLPDISFGFTQQQIEGVSGLHAYSIGLSIPLFINQKNATVQATKIQHDIALLQSEEITTALQNELNSLFSQFNAVQSSLMYYQNIGLSLASNLESSAVTGYASGDIMYTEFLAGIEQASKIKLEHLALINQQNQITLRINFLTGN